MARQTLLHRIAAGVVLFASMNAWARSVRIIANSSVRADEISLRDLRSIFLLERISLSDGTRVEPVLERSGPAHQVFLKDFLGKTDDGLHRYYEDLVFTGRGLKPKALGSDAEVAAYVARTKGAIGYVDEETNTPGAKTLMIATAQTKLERELIARVEPHYPDELERRSIGGVVRLRITIRPLGDIARVEVIGGNPILGEAAAAAVEKWRYSTAASQTILDLSITFTPRH